MATVETREGYGRLWSYIAVEEVRGFLSKSECDRRSADKVYSDHDGLKGYYCPKTTMQGDGTEVVTGFIARIRCNEWRWEADEIFESEELAAIAIDSIAEEFMRTRVPPAGSRIFNSSLSEPATASQKDYIRTLAKGAYYSKIEEFYDYSIYPLPKIDDLAKGEASDFISYLKK